MACKGTTKEGAPCGMPEAGNTGFCFAHAPEFARQRQEARRKGGISSQRRSAPDPAAPVALQSLPDVLALLEVAAGDAMGRKPSLQRARALCYVAVTAVKVLEVGDLAERLEALERTLERERTA